MIIGAGSTAGFMVVLVVLVGMSSMLGSSFVVSLSMGSVFETTAESGVETVVMKGGRTRRPFDFRISLILSCWTPMWSSRRPELAKVFWQMRHLLSSKSSAYFFFRRPLNNKTSLFVPEN